MTITYRNNEYAFRDCDTKNIGREELEKLAEVKGRLQYEPNRVWLYVPSVGYGMEHWHDVMNPYNQ